ncbi:GHKL domain-containing protein [Lactococcus raffinolactis]|uniref:histidine kinase n=1 Tax=Pseudolactococcus raffinolactis TaxID=1366 RepID=A0A6H0UD23_9LACT|nr:ATP-binding protein [Lactococcus raffinolactis]QIW54090.1 GHKL domain-containing protein [Lactococcus raffinolactis]
MIIYGLILGCTIKIDASLVIALLLAISYLAMMTLADAKSLWRPILLTGLFFTFSIIYPLCLLFSPLIILDSIRKSVHDLHDDAVDLEKALEEIIADFSFCPVDFSYHLSKTIAREVKYNVIAIVKEALNNVMKHSNAKLVQLTVSESEDLYQVMIEDNGTTISPNTPTNPLNIETRGIGLINMTERVKKLHGTITFYSQNGFRIYIKMPKH